MLKIRKKLGSELFGAYKSAFYGTGIEFAEHRDYQIGDQIKFIDWKASAKSQKLLVKKFEEERNLQVNFIIDNEVFGFSSEKDNLVKEFIGIIALTALANNDIINIFNPQANQTFTKIKDEKIFLGIIEKLKTGKTKNISLNEFIKKNLEIFKKSLIFLVTDTNDFSKISELKLLELKNEVIVVNIFDYFENNLENLPFFVNLNGNLPYLGDKEGINKFRQLRKEKIEKFKLELQKNNIHYLYLDTKLDPYLETYKFFMNLQ